MHNRRNKHVLELMKIGFLCRADTSYMIIYKEDSETIIKQETDN